MQQIPEQELAVIISLLMLHKTSDTPYYEIINEAFDAANYIKNKLEMDNVS